jgi:hypothetical protein
MKTETNNEQEKIMDNVTINSSQEVINSSQKVIVMALVKNGAQDFMQLCDVCYDTAPGYVSGDFYAALRQLRNLRVVEWVGGRYDLTKEAAFIRNLFKE